MKNVIITGADGFVGSYTASRFVKEGCHVLALDMGAEPRRLQSSELLTYMQCDIADVNGMLAKIDNRHYL